jgi:hypothetical protein
MGGLKNVYAIGAGKYSFAVRSLNWLENFWSGKWTFISSHETLDQIIAFFSIEPIKLLLWHYIQYCLSCFMKYGICIHWMLQCCCLWQMQSLRFVAHCQTWHNHAVVNTVHTTHMPWTKKIWFQ